MPSVYDLKPRFQALLRPRSAAWRGRRRATQHRHRGGRGRLVRGWWLLIVLARPAGAARPPGLALRAHGAERRRRHAGPGARTWPAGSGRCSTSSGDVLSDLALYLPLAVVRPDAGVVRRGLRVRRGADRDERHPRPGPRRAPPLRRPDGQERPRRAGGGAGGGDGASPPSLGVVAVGARPRPRARRAHLLEPAAGRRWAERRAGRSRVSAPALTPGRSAGGPDASLGAAGRGDGGGAAAQAAQAAADFSELWPGPLLVGHGRRCSSRRWRCTRRCRSSSSPS